jgi:methylthioribose-1-phosphate isomerase
MTSVDWVAGKVRFIDQTKLPDQEVYVETTEYRRVGDAIRKLEIRGAPAIGVAAAFAVVLAVRQSHVSSPSAIEKELTRVVGELSATRPTAVNLFACLSRMRASFARLHNAESDLIREGLLQEALAIQREDAEACRIIGEYGATLLSAGSSILTHCNTGALATAGQGTAQSVITTAAKLKKIARVYVDETRPLFQGARLTSWELLKEGIDLTLITDSTAGLVMQQKKVDAVIVGADRIAANGDAANKVGTYPLAILAERHGVPFYIAAPTSTIDRATPSGAAITIEERDPSEVTHVRGIRIAAEGVKVFAPAFDITPAALITAIVTERGILKQPYNVSIAGLAVREGGNHA